MLMIDFDYGVNKKYLKEILQLIVKTSQDERISPADIELINALVFCTLKNKILTVQISKKKSGGRSYTFANESGDFEGTIPLHAVNYAESFNLQFEMFPVLGESVCIKEVRAHNGRLYTCEISGGQVRVKSPALRTLPLAALYARIAYMKKIW